MAAAKILTDKDVDLRPLLEILCGDRLRGAGSAHALNLRDSGVCVVVGLPQKSRSHSTARRDGLCLTTTVNVVARADYPGIWEIVSFESEVLRMSQGPAAALPLVENYHRANWWNYPATLALGRLRAQNGEVAPAAAALREASRLDVHEVEALNLLAELQVNQNHLGEAIAAQRRAVSRGVAPA